MIPGELYEVSYLMCFHSDTIARDTRAPLGEKKGVEDNVICETIMTYVSTITLRQAEDCSIDGSRHTEIALRA